MPLIALIVGVSISLMKEKGYFRKEIKMTREEANEILENWIFFHYTPSREAAEAVISALVPLEIISALRSVSRERVEKVWRGEWHRHYKSGIHAGNGVVCSKCDMWNNRGAHFCPSCGAPMTDEAVQMVMDRLEALYGDR